MVIRSPLTSQSNGSWEAQGGEPAPVRAGFAPTLSFHVPGKDGHRTAHHAHGAIGMSARPAPVHFAQAPMKSRHDVLVALAARQPRQVASDGGESVDARAALPGALIRQVAGNPC